MITRQAGDLGVQQTVERSRLLRHVDEEYEIWVLKLSQLEEDKVADHNMKHSSGRALPLGKMCLVFLKTIHFSVIRPFRAFRIC